MANVENINQKILTQSNGHLASKTISPLWDEYEEHLKLFDAQPVMIQRFIEGQGKSLSEQLIREQSQLRFSLPDSVVIDPLNGKTMAVPANIREQVTGGVIDRLTRTDLRTVLRLRLTELEESPKKPIATSANLIRFATAHHLVYNSLPSGKQVVYLTGDGEETPAIPDENSVAGSAITQQSDAIVEEGAQDDQRGEMQVPFVKAAASFYLPQWVAFDTQGHLLANTLSEADSSLSSMQKYLAVLHTAISLAPYFVADDEYQAKRYGMLGQLIHQGRSFAKYQTLDMIRIIKQRAANHDLNRGLSLTIPYFDDQSLKMLTREFTVIPAGRIMFVPAFVIRAAREEMAKVAQDTRLNASTRKYLLIQLKTLESAFQ